VRRADEELFSQPLSLPCLLSCLNHSLSHAFYHFPVPTISHSLYVPACATNAETTQYILSSICHLCFFSFSACSMVTQSLQYDTCARTWRAAPTFTGILQSHAYIPVCKSIAHATRRRMRITAVIISRHSIQRCVHMWYDAPAVK